MKSAQGSAAPTVVSTAASVHRHAHRTPSRHDARNSVVLPAPRINSPGLDIIGKSPAYRDAAPASTRVDQCSAYSVRHRLRYHCTMFVVVVIQHFYSKVIERSPVDQCDCNNTRMSDRTTTEHCEKRDNLSVSCFDSLRQNPHY